MGNQPLLSNHLYRAATATFWTNLFLGSESSPIVITPIKRPSSIISLIIKKMIKENTVQDRK